MSQKKNDRPLKLPGLGTTTWDEHIFLQCVPWTVSWHKYTFDSFNFEACWGNDP